MSIFGISIQVDPELRAQHQHEVEMWFWVGLFSTLGWLFVFIQHNFRPLQARLLASWRRRSWATLILLSFLVGWSAVLFSGARLTPSVQDYAKTSIVALGLFGWSIAIVQYCHSLARQT